MPVDTSIYGALGVRPKSALEYGDEMDMSALRQQNMQTNALAMQGTRQKLDDTSRLVGEQAGVRNRLAGLQVGATDHDRANALYAEGTPTAIAMADKLRTAADNSRKTNSEATNKDTESENRIIGVYRDLIGMANDPATAATYVQTMHADPRLAQTSMARVPLDLALREIGQDPKTFGEWKQKFALGAKTYVEQNKPQYVTQNLGGTSQITALPGLGGGPASVVSSAPISQSADNAATVGATMAGQRSTAATAAAALRQNDAHFGVEQGNQNLRAGLNPDGSIKGMATDGSGKIDLAKVAPEDLAAAYRYKADGTLPSNMGRGQQGAFESKRLRAIASALDDQAGESPEDARIRQLALKGDVTAINQMRRREVAVGANVKNFDFNAEQVLELSKKVDRSGVPILNAWINAGRRSVTGNPELSAFDVAVKTTVNEFAQIVSGTTAGATTEGEKKKAEQLLNAQQTPEQIVSVINQMQIESKNRMKSFADQRKQSMPTNRPGGSPSAPAGGAASGQTGSAAPVASGFDAEKESRYQAWKANQK